MEKTLIIWHRLGKEHGETSGFRVNPPDVVARHLEEKARRFRETPTDQWRWWKVSDELIVEKPCPNGYGFQDDTIIYYLPRMGWGIVQNFHPRALAPDWTWYIHIARMAFDRQLGAWVFTDMLADIVVNADRITHRVLDLDELALARELSLVTEAEMLDALRDTQTLADLICAGGFPPAEVTDCTETLRTLGWQ